MKAKEIDKDEILNVRFVDEDVLENESKRTDRWLKLREATFDRKNKTQSKMKIVFKGMKKGFVSVNSRVIKAQSDYIILSGGYVLPMRSIYKVE
ncbi:MAG: hypothetical protein HUJ25_02770 [Crocinitomicaceae bacterium]|nr:hypothetical protein [Crocinitomicaceae bacterium]